MIEQITIAFLLVFMGVQEYLNRAERKKLTEMIMAKSLSELREAEEKERVIAEPSISRQPDLVPFDLADQDMFDTAIKKQLRRETPLEKAKARLKKIARR